MARRSDVSFSPSKLGTKEHWDAVYKSELSTYEEIGDEGEIWFGEEIVEKMRDWVIENVSSSQKLHILDLGSGNGNLLFSLSDAGYDGSLLLGIDYSMDAVRLARSIAASRDAKGVQFECVDLLGDDVDLSPSSYLKSSATNADDSSLTETTPLKSRKWDLILDKGTYDAISLSGPAVTEGSSPLELYASKIAKIICSNGTFMITSCNFTEKELLDAFQRPELGLSFHSRIKHRSLTFGGVQGNTYTTVAFKAR